MQKMCPVRRLATSFVDREREKDTSTFFLFSKSGVTDDCRSATKKINCALVSLADMKLGGAELL